MKLRTNIVSILLSAVLVVTLLPSVVLAETSHNINTDGSINITSAGEYFINGTGVSTANTITVNANITGNVNITLNNVNISAGTAFSIGTGSEVSLTLEGSNYLYSSGNAGLALPDGAALTITDASTGILEATGGFGAGIGGYASSTKYDNSYGGSCGSVTINGGSVKGIGNGAAGIGGGGASSEFYSAYGGSTGIITINGGVVTAQTASAYGPGAFYNTPAGPGIGGGYANIGNGDGSTVNGSSTIIINGGSVNTSMGSPVHNSSGQQLYFVTIPGFPASTVATYTVNGSSISESYATDSSGRLYLWLPESTLASVLVEIGGCYYQAYGAVSKTVANTFSTALKLNSTTLPQGSIGDSYNNAGLSANGGSGTYSWSATGLPAGMEIDGLSGVIRGTPTEGGSFSVGVTVIDANYGGTASVTLPLTINLTYSTYLTALSVGSGTLLPQFNENTMAYKVSGSDYTSGSINVTATRYDIDSELMIAGYSQPHDQTVTQEVYLNNGANLIPVVVSAADSSSVQRAYIISVNGIVSDADLENLSFSDGSIAFDTATTSYYFNVGSDVTSVGLTAAASDSKAVMLLNGSILSQGGTKNLSLATGENIMTLMVIAQDATTKTYTITVNRGTSDATLSGLSLSSGTLSPLFSTLTFNYSVTIPYTVSGISATPTPSDSNATVTVNGGRSNQDIDMDVGENTVTVAVTGKDGVTKKTYTITVTRQAEVTITTMRLPVGIIGANYSTALTATGGDGSYTWSATGLPAELTIDATSGMITGIPANAGNYTCNITVRDSEGVSATNEYTLKLNTGCGNGAYIIESDGNGAYTGSYTDDGIPTLTVNSGVTGFTYFGVSITPVTGHSGMETMVFVQIRDGKEINFSFIRNDFDTVGSAQAAFNVKAGDIIEMYIVDQVSNSVGSSPRIL